MIWRPLALLLVACVQLSTCYYDTNDRLRKMDRKIERLEDRVDRLTNEITSNLEPNPCPQYEEFPNQRGRRPSLVPLEARRESLGTGSQRVTLKFYTGPFTVVKANWINAENWEDRLEEEIPNEIPRFRPGVRVTSTTVNETITRVMLYLYVNLDSYEFEFNMTSGAPESQTCIPLPILSIEPEGDIVYVPGADKTIQVTVPPEHRPSESSGPGGYYRNLEIDPYLVDLRTGIMKTRLEADEYAEQESRLQLLTSTKMTITLKTSNFSLSGYARFKVDDGLREGALVINVKREEAVVVRPSNQSGPYPEDYLTFLNAHYYQADRNPSGTETRLCDIRNGISPTCYIGCAVLGTGLSSLDIYRITNSGRRQRITDVGVEMVNQNTLKSLWYQQAPENDTVHVQCVATNTRGRVKTHDILVSFFSRARIDSVMSGIRRRGNESELELVCVADGDPQFNLTFNLNGYSQEPDNVTQVGNHVMAVKFARLPTGPYDNDGLYTADCSVEQTLQDEHYSDYYNFDLHDESSYLPPESGDAMDPFARYVLENYVQGQL